MAAKKFAIDFGETQLWVVPLCRDQSAILQLEKDLAADEICRADRFVTNELRNRFIACRGALRRLLAGHLGCRPADVVFHYEQWGKPYVSRSLSEIHFNVSHSDDWGVIALSHQPVGVDLEAPNKRTNFRAIASQVLSADEETNYQAIPHQQRDESILKLWVCKEALLKALGLGIAEGLQKVSFNLPIRFGEILKPASIEPSLQLHLEEDGTCSRHAWLDVNSWRVQLVETGPGCTAAVATMPGSIRVTCRHYSDSI